MSDMITVGSRVTWPDVNALVVNGRVLEQRNVSSLVKWADGSGPTWHITAHLRLVPAPRMFGTAKGGMLRESTPEPVAEITAHNLAVVVARLIDARNLDEVYQDDPVVHHLINLGSRAIAPTLRPTPGDRDGRARAHAQFVDEVREMSAPMRGRALKEVNAAINHLQRHRERIMRNQAGDVVIVHKPADPATGAPAMVMITPEA